MASIRDELIAMLETTPNHPSIRSRIAELEAKQPADLNTDAARLQGRLGVALEQFQPTMASSGTLVGQSPDPGS